MSSVILTAVCAIRNLWSNALSNSEKHNSVCFWLMVGVTLCSWHLRSSEYPELGSNSSSPLAVWLLVYWVSWLSLSRVKMTRRVVVRLPTGIHSWLLSNRNLNCMGPLIYGVFFLSVVNTEVLHDLLLVESTDLELWIQRNHLYRGVTVSYMWIFNCRGSATLTLPPYGSAVHQTLWKQVSIEHLLRTEYCANRIVSFKP